MNRVIACTLCVGCALLTPWVLFAESPLTDTISATVTCRPYNQINADAGMTVVECKYDGGTMSYRSVFAEVDTDAGVYFCQKSGATSSNFASVCHKRCKGCLKGEGFGGEQAKGTLKCVSPTPDAGAVLVVSCGR